MTFWKLFLAVVFPPFAVADKGCGMMLLIGFLTLWGWVPGMLAALLIVAWDGPNRAGVPRVEGFSVGDRRYVRIPTAGEPDVVVGKAKRKGAYIRLADGEMAEVVEDDGAPLEKRKRRLMDDLPG